MHDGQRGRRGSHLCHRLLSHRLLSPRLLRRFFRVGALLLLRERSFLRALQRSLAQLGVLESPGPLLLRGPLGFLHGGEFSLESADLRRLRLDLLDERGVGRRGGGRGGLGRRGRGRRRRRRWNFDDDLLGDDALGALNGNLLDDFLGDDAFGAGDGNLLDDFFGDDPFGAGHLDFLDDFLGDDAFGARNLDDAFLNLRLLRAKLFVLFAKLFVLFHGIPQSLLEGRQISLGAAQVILDLRELLAESLLVRSKSFGLLLGGGANLLFGREQLSRAPVQLGQAELLGFLQRRQLPHLSLVQQLHALSLSPGEFLLLVERELVLLLERRNLRFQTRDDAR